MKSSFLGSLDSNFLMLDVIFDQGIGVDFKVVDLMWLDCSTRKNTPVSHI